MYRIQWRRGVSRKLLAASAHAESAPLIDILDALSTIESLLHNEPEFVGESRNAVEQLLIVEPISVVYKIDHRRRIVHVLRAKVRFPRFKRGHPGIRRGQSERSRAKNLSLRDRSFGRRASLSMT